MQRGGADDEANTDTNKATDNGDLQAEQITIANASKPDDAVSAIRLRGDRVSRSQHIVCTSDRAAASMWGLTYRGNRRPTARAKRRRRGVRVERPVRWQLFH